MAKYFLGSVGEATALRTNANGVQEVVFHATSITDQGINISSSQDEIRAGQGAPIVATFNHDASVQVTLTDVFWKTGYVESKLGVLFSGGTNDYQTETKQASAGKITLDKAPVKCDYLPCSEDPAYLIWYSKAGSDKWDPFTGIPSGEGLNELVGAFEDGATYCIRYLANDEQARSAWITSDILPQELYLIIRTPVYAGDSCAASGGAMAGHITFEIPRYRLDPNLDLSFAMSSNVTMSISGMALAYTAGCNANGSNLMRITENLEGRKWYDGLVAIYIDPAFDPATAPARIPVYGVYENGGTVLLDNTATQLTFSAEGKVITATIAVTGGLNDSDNVTLTKTPTLGEGANKGIITALA